ncbi:MAG: type IV pilus assembly protein PilM [Candidatus Omnitrophota bacterium]
MIDVFLEKYFSVIREFLPEKGIKPSIGLDIGSDSLKAIEVVGREGTFEISNWITEPANPLNTNNLLRKILGKLDASSKNVSTSVSGKGTLIRYIDMPRMPIEDLRNSINIEADKHFPFPRDQINTDCFILDPKNKDSKMHVLVAAAKKDVIEQRMRLLTSLEIKPEFIGINSLAIANILNVSGLKAMNQINASQSNSKDEVIAILDIGHCISSLIIIKGAMPYFTRDIFLGGQDLNKRIANVLSLEGDEAQRLKCEPGDRLEEIQRACESILTNLISEIRLSFDYFVTEKNIPISKLLLTGGSSKLKGIVEFFGRNLDLPVEEWNPLDGFEISPHLSNKNELLNDSHRLGVALGLALYNHD